MDTGLQVFIKSSDDILRGLLQILLTVFRFAELEWRQVIKN